ncbi:uncharacterized protein DUF4321 [Anaerospora hongkongensis]|jgi:hypothetical protein|uniref:Uncharacterized protein DUF4321 n=1 Tax=Anaerospora hongkongensis TaxID=244830 RepID=A0A4R1Q5U6_9FIRM|nr:DUF4321 domain-containing protein [Anaerospora hongkongensis]TCL36487.1 uncharacterized protein DUF4321 [Anaerospora hongkongensis]
MRGGSNKGFGMLALFLITGAVLGGIIGEIIADSTLLAGVTPYLVKQFLIFDLPPVTINLYVIKFVIGFALYPNLISLLGMVAAAALFRRF